MITKRTVLILGAGASAPYRFPCGEKLTLDICRDIPFDKNDVDLSVTTPSSFIKRILSCNLPWDQVKEFGECLYRSSQESVDAFLEHRTEFMDIGKHCIACALIPYEDERYLFRNRGYHLKEEEVPKDHWYEFLFRKMTKDTKPDKFGQNRLSIITFNYDRSLEHFLFVSLKNSFGLSDEETTRLLRSIPIIHLHGNLGPLPHLDPDGKGRDYAPTITPEIIKDCAASIKIIHEDIGNDFSFVQAHNLIREAEVVCFLGFGYHPTNMERLKINKLLNPDIEPLAGNKYIVGTAHEMPPSEKAAVEENFNMIKLPHSTDSSYDALGLLHNEYILK